MFDRLLIILGSALGAQTIVALIGTTNFLSRFIDHAYITQAAILLYYICALLLALCFYFFTSRPYSLRRRMLSCLLILGFALHNIALW